MVGFTEETQKKVDEKNADTAMALESTQALLKVSEAARLAMPRKGLFWARNNFLERGPYEAILRGFIPNFNSDVRKRLGKKTGVHFGFIPDGWAVSSSQNSEEQSEELQCFNSTLTKDPLEWVWDKDRHVSAIIWLDDSEEDILEFPYLALPEEGPPRMKAIARSILVFPSHPMYAFQFLKSENVRFLEAHGTAQGCELPETNSNNLELD